MLINKTPLILDVAVINTTPLTLTRTTNAELANKHALNAKDPDTGAVQPLPPKRPDSIMYDRTRVDANCNPIVAFTEEWAA